MVGVLIVTAARRLQKASYKMIKYSPWLVHFNTGACNGCDIEVLTAITPLYDPERYGIKLAP
ncbi:MAG: NADH-quinone oxidoreductase subunit B, partial [Desulfurococcaceae archaeon]